VEIQVQKLYCVSRAVPISVEDASQNEQDVASAKAVSWFSIARQINKSMPHALNSVWAYILPYEHRLGSSLFMWGKTSGWTTEWSTCAHPPTRRSSSSKAKWDT
jgi:hypothetical protein